MSVFFSLSLFSPGEVPDTREALLNAFKRLDNDISLEAQVRTVILIWNCAARALRGKKAFELGLSCSIIYGESIFKQGMFCFLNRFLGVLT